MWVDGWNAAMHLSRRGSSIRRGMGGRSPLEVNRIGRFVFASLAYIEQIFTKKEFF